MADGSGPGKFPITRVVWLTIVAALIFGAGFLTAVLIWNNVGGGVWRSEVDVKEAWLRSPNELALVASSCGGDPEVSELRESDVEVQIKVISSTTPMLGGNDCLDGVQIQLREPLGNRKVIDMHTGRVVEVRGIISAE